MSETKRRANRQTPWDGSAGPETATFGGWLRREREARDVTLAEIADVTKISKAYLQALEDERFDVLPAPVFAKGFLREYAKYVGLDPDEVVNSYLTAMQANEPDGQQDEISSGHRGSFEWTSGVLLAIGLVVLLGAIGFLGFWAERSQDDAPPSIEVPAGPAPTAPGLSESKLPIDEAAGPVPVEVFEPPSPAVLRQTAGLTAAQSPTGQVEAAAEPPAPLVVTIDFTQDCWVEASVDGRRRLSELHVQGESVQISADRRVELTLGNPRAVRVEVNGEPYTLREYRPGRVARDIVILAEGEE